MKSSLVAYQGQHGKMQDSLLVSTHVFEPKIYLYTHGRLESIAFNTLGPGPHTSPQKGHGRDGQYLSSQAMKAVLS